LCVCPSGYQAAVMYAHIGKTRVQAEADLTDDLHGRGHQKAWLKPVVHPHRRHSGTAADGVGSAGTRVHASGNVKWSILRQHRCCHQTEAQKLQKITKWCQQQQLTGPTTRWLNDPHATCRPDSMQCDADFISIHWSM